ncbi:MAG: hypothetical protein WCK77_25235 [Verrucomicrobiota bacterium]
MIRFDGLWFNEFTSRRIMAELARHNPAHAKLSHDQVANRVTRFSFMSALAKLNGLPFFPRVAEFCDGTLQVGCNPKVLAGGLFTPLCRSGQDSLIVALADPWSLLPDAYLAPLFPDLELVRIVTLAPEITRSIQAATLQG